MNVPSAFGSIATSGSPKTVNICMVCWEDIVYISNSDLSGDRKEIGKL